MICCSLLVGSNTDTNRYEISYKCRKWLNKYRIDLFFQSFYYFRTRLTLALNVTSFCCLYFNLSCKIGHGSVKFQYYLKSFAHISITRSWDNSLTTAFFLSQCYKRKEYVIIIIIIIITIIIIVIIICSSISISSSSYTINNGSSKEIRRVMLALE
jgi:hypothetical protein